METWCEQSAKSKLEKQRIYIKLGVEEESKKTEVIDQGTLKGFQREKDSEEKREQIKSEIEKTYQITKRNKSRKVLSHQKPKGNEEMES